MNQRLMNLEFEQEIEELEKKIPDENNQDDLIVFYGSSSLRLWDTLKEDMEPLNVLNLAFGGSSFSWCIYYFDRLFAKLKPKHLVIYVGDNDLANGIPPEKVLKKFKALMKLIRLNFPAVSVDYITIKPSPIRTNLLPEIILTNSLIRKEILGMKKVRMLNVFDSMLNEQNVARPELYLEDELHMNAEGYKIWRGILRRAFEI